MTQKRKNLIRIPNRIGIEVKKNVSLATFQALVEKKVTSPHRVSVALMDDKGILHIVEKPLIGEYAYRPRKRKQGLWRKPCINGACETDLHL